MESIVQTGAAVSSEGMFLDDLLRYSTLLSNMFTIAASGIAVYLFLSKRKQIASALKLLLNYSYQLTLSELKEKLERLNDFNANNDAERITIINILNEIVGQIRGNMKLKVHLSDLLDRMENIVANEDALLEPMKRSFVSELRERLRHLNVENMDKLQSESLWRTIRMQITNSGSAAQ